MYPQPGREPDWFGLGGEGWLGLKADYWQTEALGPKLNLLSTTLQSTGDDIYMRFQKHSPTLAIAVKRGDKRIGEPALELVGCPTAFDDEHAVNFTASVHPENASGIGQA